ncbi:MAG: sarcosine oxidase subunit delta [Hasllibacter sp.]
MLMIRCPACGAIVEETELTPGGEAHVARAGPGADDAATEEYLFHRTNPKGVHIERWRHAHGCGKWFHAARDTATLQIFATYRADVTEPPEDVVRAVAAHRRGWTPEDWRARTRDGASEAPR